MMRCPYCLEKLVRIEDKRYQTLSEHVSLQEIYTPRKAYGCPKGCTEGSFFDPYGARYGNVEIGEPLEAINSIECRISNWDRWDWWTLTEEMKIFGEFMKMVEVGI